MNRIQVKPEIIGVVVVKDIDPLAVAAYDGLIRAIALVDLLDTASLTWLRQRLLETEREGDECRAVTVPMRDLIDGALGAASPPVTREHQCSEVSAYGEGRCVCDDRAEHDHVFGGVL